MSDPATTTALVSLIHQRITNSPQQRITFAEFMDLALYHPQHGYYSSGAMEIGQQGDYFTASSLGKDFGELLAEQFRQMWQILGQPQPFTLLEMGAGNGQLANDILAYLQVQDPPFFHALDYVILDIAGTLVQQQQQTLSQWCDRPKKITWKTWSNIADHSLVGCAFSNELVDAFPVHKITLQSGHLQEVYVTLVDGQFTEIAGPLSTDRLDDYFDLVNLTLPTADYPEGYQSEVNLAALDWLQTVSQKLKQGYLLTIDYGYPAQRYYSPQRYQGTLQCYYQHRRHHHPYRNLGQQDITTQVNFTALERYGEQCNLPTFGSTKQGMFLMALGWGDRLTELSSGKFDLPTILQRRDALHQLVNPAGLGNFTVLVQSKGLTTVQQRRSLRGFTVPDEMP